MFGLLPTSHPRDGEVERWSQYYNVDVRVNFGTVQADEISNENVRLR